VSEKTMLWELSGSTFVIVHSASAPHDDDYDSALGGYAKHLGRFRGILIHSTGGSPNAAQRKRTTDFWQGKTLPKTVIMTSSVVARGAITALNWFVSQPLKAVRPDDFREAFEYLEVVHAEQASVEETVTKLRRGLVASSAASVTP